MYFESCRQQFVVLARFHHPSRTVNGILSSEQVENKLVWFSTFIYSNPLDTEHCLVKKGQCILYINIVSAVTELCDVISQCRTNIASTTFKKFSQEK